MKLLLVAPTCDGEDVGEAWVAYNWVTGLARHHDVTLLTYHKRGSTPAAKQFPDLRVVEWEEPPLLGRAERLNSMLKPGYVAFHSRARRWIRKAQARGERFDLAFQPVPVAMRYPCPARGSGIPYVMGPVGGSLSTPPGFTDDEGSAPWYVGLRALDRWRIAHDPWLRRTYTEAACVLGIAPYVRDFLGDLPIRRFESLSETAIDGVPPRLDRSDRRGPVRLLYVGRLVRTKGARDAVRALARVPDATVVLDVVGDGFDREACETEARELGVADRVAFHGRLPREEIDPLYRAADVFVFPSYREPGGNVTFEAMSWSLPLVVSDRGGPGTVVDDTCGIRVHPETPEAYAADLARAITRLVQNADERHKLGEGAWRRVQEVGLWDAKVGQVGALFEELATS